MFYKQTPVKKTGNGLAAGCQVFYRKIYGFFVVCDVIFLSCRNASRLALESREAMFRRAMTLLSARCTSLKQGLDPEQLQVPFGVQVPKYFYVTQEKPLPMEPLKVGTVIVYFSFCICIQVAH